MSLSSQKTIRERTVLILLILLSCGLLVSAQTDDIALKEVQARAATREASRLMKLGTGESLEAALQKLKEAAGISREIGDKESEAVTLMFAGLISNRLGSGNDALGYYGKALSLFRINDDKKYEARTLNGIGLVFSGIGEKEKALDSYNRSLEISKAIGAAGDYAVTLGNIGKVYLDSGEYETALKYYQQALPLVRTVANRIGEAAILNDIGVVHSKLGEKRKAFGYLTEAMEIYTAVSNIQGQATTFNNIGRIYEDLGEKARALEFFDKSLRLNKASGDKSGEATTLNNIGNIYAGLGEYPKALDHFKRALALLELLGDRRRQAGIFNNAGRVYVSSGNGETALEYFNPALDLYRDLGDRSGEAVTLNNLGGAYSSLGDKKKAKEYYQQALPALNSIGDKRNEAGALSNLMYVSRELKNPRLATFYGKQSVRRYQQLRGLARQLEGEAQRSFLNSVKRTYQELAVLLGENGQPDLAVRVLMMYQDQQFFDFDQQSEMIVEELEFSRRETSFSDRYKTAIENVGSINRKIVEFERSFGDEPLGKEESARLKNLESERELAIDSFSKLLLDAEGAFSQEPDEQDKVSPTSKVFEMQRALFELSASTKKRSAAVYTLTGEHKFHIFLLTPRGKFKHFETPIKLVDLNDKILRFYGLLQSPNYDPRPVGKELYDIILKPAEAELKKQKIKTLMWQLDGNLRYIPVAALFDGEKYLAETYQTVVFTRSDPDRLLRPVTPRWTGTGFGSSQSHTVDLLGDGEQTTFSALPGVTAELSSIFPDKSDGQRILSGEVISDGRFTKDAFYSALKKKLPLVHISSHFVFRPGDSSRSYLLLGDGNVLTLNEMSNQANLFQGVELLALSACDTAAVRADSNGKEIDGFAELAQRLGAAAVMATLWQVSDASTPWLVRKFYLTRQAEIGTTKTEALQQAQLALIYGTTGTISLPDVEKRGSTPKLRVVIVPDADAQRGNADKTRSEIIYLGESDAPRYEIDEKRPYAHPYYWAPFVVYGNWK